MEEKRREALISLHQLLDDGAAAPYLLFMITRQFRLAIKAKELLDKKIPFSELGGRLELSSEYALRKTISQAKRHSIEEMEKIYRQLLDTDISIKTGNSMEELALDTLAVTTSVPNLILTSERK
jgi:DNA polymerase-3 subunit delta